MYYQRQPFRCRAFTVPEETFSKPGRARQATLPVEIQQKILSDKLTVCLNFENMFNTRQVPVSLYSDSLSVESLNKLTARYVS
jgi:hypothetical protein